MKVYIGPYKNYFGTYQLAGLLRHFGVSEDRCDEIGEKLQDSFVGKLLHSFDGRRKRKIKIRIDKYDTWSMDHTLAMIVLPMLKQLKETKHGSAGGMKEFAMTSEGTSQYCFDFYAEGDDAAWEAGHKKWDETLDKMIWSFEQILDDGADSQFWIKRKEGEEPSISPSLVEKFDIVRDMKFDHVAYRKHYERVEEGLQLFGKHFQDLWD